MISELFKFVCAVKFYRIILILLKRRITILNKKNLNDMFKMIFEIHTNIFEMYTYVSEVCTKIFEICGNITENFSHISNDHYLE